MTEATRAVRPLAARSDRLSATRRATAIVLAAFGLPVAAAALGAADGLALASSLLLLLLGVVVVAVVGGTVVGLGAAVLSFLLANWFLIPPLHTLRIEDRDNVVALVVFLAVALTTSALVELAARRRAAVERSRAESLVLARMATRPVATSVESVLEDVAATFGLTSVALVAAPGMAPVAAHGPPVSSTPTVRIDAAPGLRLVADGPPLFAEDRRLLGELAAAAARALEEREMSDQASRARELAEVDRVRSALLAAVGHDLRTPLATVKAAVTGLRHPGVELPDADRDELLATIESASDRLTDMVANLLDLSRLRTGGVAVRTEDVALDEVVARALVLGSWPDVDVRVPDDLPLVRTDPALLERVVGNLVDNATRHEPAGGRVVVDAVVEPGAVLLLVQDHGPGVPESDRERMFEPFQRLDDRGGSGVGLGLAIVAGFAEAVGGRVVPSTTPGGGLTMTVTVRRTDGCGA